MDGDGFGRGSQPAVPAETVDADQVDAGLLAMVDPELRAAALQMRRTTVQFTPMTDDKLARRRALISAYVAPLAPEPPVSERRIPGPPEAPDLAVYVVGRVQPGARRPVILHMHGGGFTASSARASVPSLQEVARALDCVVVSVDYRKAPETRYDGALEDNYAALRWSYDEAEALGLDRDRIALMGESGGGGHAALLGIAARDRGEIPVAFQALIYPMIDDRTGSSRTTPPHLGYFNWNAEANRFGWRCFLGQAPGTDAVPAHAVPARVEDLSGLPPTFIGVGALDLFVDENIAYARRLLEAGVPTELVVAPGAFHGFDMVAKEAAVSRRFTAAKLDALRRGLGLG